MTSILQTSTRRADISFFPNGRIDISAHVARQLHLADGDVIDIGCADGEYYLYIRVTAPNVVGRHAGVCHPTKARSNNFRAYSVRLTSALARLVGSSAILRCPCGDAELHANSIRIPIITRLAL